MKSIESDDHRLFSRIIDFSQKMLCRSSRGHDAPEQVLSSVFPTLMNCLSLPDFVRLVVDDVKSDSMSNLSKVIAVARAMLSAKVGSSAEASSLLLDSKLNLRGSGISAWPRDSTWKLGNMFLACPSFSLTRRCMRWSITRSTSS